MENLFENWYIILAFVCVGVVGGYSTMTFLKLPTSEKLDRFKSVLYDLVLEAEEKFQSGEGTKKLEYVYNAMVNNFPFITTFMTFETFKTLVNGALYDVGIWLKK